MAKQRGDYCHSGLPEGEMAKYYGQNCQNLEKWQNTGVGIAIWLLWKVKCQKTGAEIAKIWENSKLQG